MWFLLIYLQIFAVQGLERVVLRGSDSPCRGRLEVYYKKEWGLVCHHGWNDRNGEVVCKSLGCGKHRQSGMEQSKYIDPPIPEKYWMDQVVCLPVAERLENCSYVTPNKEHGTESFVAVECAGNVVPSLNMNGQTDKCAGVVQFSTQMGVFGICNSGWDEGKANKICQELNCGQHYYIPKSGVFKQHSQFKGLFNCSGEKNKDFSWQCMDRSVDCRADDASVICTNHRRFRLQNGRNLCSGWVQEYNVATRSWVSLQQKDVPPETVCAQMNCGATGNFTDNNGTKTLTCSDDVKLRNFTSACFGSVDVVVNAVNRGVCYSHTLSRNLGKVVCRELKCGEVLDVIQGSWIKSGWLSNVECQGDEESLWHCLAKHENTECHSTKVICSDSLKMRLADGFGRCSGRVNVKLGDSWTTISSNGWTNSYSDVVCKHLGCGNATKITEELFIQRNQKSDWKMKCESASEKLHKCLEKIDSKTPETFSDSKQIICQEEKLMFFDERPCQGRVRMESFGGKRDWLTSNKTTSDVCTAMHCGHQLSFERDQDMMHFNCSGSVSVDLSNKCWGAVKVCRDDKCGGVCQQTWKTKHSKLLCGNLGCGDPMKRLFPLQQKLQVKHYSVYCSEEVKNLSMCNFVSNNGSSCSDPASVICTGNVQAKLEDPRDKCAGNVKLSYAGRWMPVCKDKGLDKGLQDTICRELNCGEAESVDVALYKESQAQGLSGIKCKRNPDSVAECNFDDIAMKACTAAYLKCSGWRRLFLYKKEGACSGPVYALSSMGSKTQKLPVSEQGWNIEARQALCKYLQCGNYIQEKQLYKNHTEDTMETTQWWNKTYHCSGEKNIWDCERESQSDQPQHQLNIKCDDGKPPNITLSSKCTGKVLVNEEPVCASYWNKQMSHNLCDSLQCGTAIDYWQSSTVNETDGWYFNCPAESSLLWQCKSWRDKCRSVISVACQSAVDFGTTKKCGGFLGVNFRDQWEYVCGHISTSDRENVCKKLECEKGQTLNEGQFNKNISRDIQVTVTCPENHQNINQCVQLLQKDKNEKCQNGPAEITCKGYVEKSQVNVGLIVGILLGILGVLALISQRNRLLSFLRRYRNKDAKDTSLRGNEMNNMETVDRDSEEKMSLFEKDDYEEVDAATINTKGEDDADDKSAGSAGTEYDDIEEQAHAVSHPQTDTENDPGLPLLPKRPENLLADEVTYEVELEGEQDYDDAIPRETLANENAGTPTTDPSARADEVLDAETNANTEVVEVDVHGQPE